MKIIQAMKEIKDLQTKAEDLRKRVAQYSADMDFETPTYGTEQDQRVRVDSWIQSHSDILKKILELRVAIQRTNLETAVPIEVNGHTVTKSIAEWIHRRRDLAKTEQEMWAGIGRKESGLREGTVQTSAGGTKDVKIRRYYDPTTRDEKLAIYQAEPSKIDATLEVVNAVTDLVKA